MAKYTDAPKWLIKDIEKTLPKLDAKMKKFIKKMKLMIKATNGK